MKGSLKVLAGVLIISLTVFLTACGGGGGGGGGGNGGGGGGNGEDGTLTGSWNGIWSSSFGVGDGNVSADLTQSGTSLSGTASITGSPCISSGSVSGTVSGNNVSFGVVSGQETVLYSATYTSSSMNGTYSVTTGACIGDTGTFSLTKVGVSSSSIEITELEGIWTGFEIYGYSEWTATVSGKNMELIGPYEWYSRGAFNINENVSPTWLDYEITESHYSGNIDKISLGIYKKEGDTLTFCFNDSGETARPSSFAPNGSFRCWELTK